MKKCPQCQADYFDEQLEFCLEDGAKLTFVRSAATVADTKVFNTAENSVATAFFEQRGGEVPQTADANSPAAKTTSLPADETKVTSLRQNAVETGSRALEIGTLVIALSNNWLQWLYIERQHYGTFTNFVFSVEFLWNGLSARNLPG